jgi:hypothetical protein
MALPDDDQRENGQLDDPCEVIPNCPICGGVMETVYDRNHQQVCVCKDCRSGLTVPYYAWEVARIKRDAKRHA